MENMDQIGLDWIKLDQHGSNIIILVQTHASKLIKLLQTGSNWSRHGIDNGLEKQAMKLWS